MIILKQKEWRTKNECRRTSAVIAATAPDKVNCQTNAVLAKAQRVSYFISQEIKSGLVEPCFDMLRSFLDPAADVKKPLGKFEDLMSGELGPVK